MNKKMRELLNKIAQKRMMAKGFMEEGENKDLEKAAALMDEADELQKEYDLEARMYEAEKEDNTPSEEEVAEKKAKEKEETATSKFAKGVRAIITKDFSGNSEGIGADGGYTVPEEIETKVQRLRETQESLIDLVSVKVVKTNKGSETYKTRGQYTGFSSIGEGGKLPKKSGLGFSRINYVINKYGGYMPVTNELVEDSDEDIEAMLVEWLANESRVTRNNLVKTIITSKAAIDLEDLDGIKKALNVTLSKFKNSAVIVTNNDGVQYLDTLKDKNDRPLLNPDPTAPTQLRLRCGTTTVAVKEYDNETIPTVSNKIPFYIGDFKEGIKFFDRKQLSLLASNVASVQGATAKDSLNAFEEDLLLIRGIEREDIQTRDAQAFVNGYIEIA
ncbi:MAG: phage major capsid protein [Clostridia bacterium]|nr:phage major capsid protein [Clostridia bacterium]